MSDEDLLPKWYASQHTPNKTNRTIGKWILIGILGIFTLGLAIIFDYTTNGMKGNN